MASRAAFLEQVWNQVINARMSARWIDAAVVHSRRTPDAPFADVGPALERLLAIGATEEDICLVARHASYEAAFQVLYMLDDPGVDGDDNKMMHEELLGADPSGREGRLGFAPPSA
jgi:hypothetical protein